MAVKRAKKKARKKALRGIGWQRLGKPEAERRPGKARIKRENVEKLREWDRARKWPCFGDGLREVERNLGVRISEIVKKRVSALPKGKKLSVMEAGCGPGKALEKLKQLFGERVRTVGLVLEKSPGEAYKGVDRLVEGKAFGGKSKGTV